MPRQMIHLEEWTDKIKQWISEGMSKSQIADQLLDEGGILISDHTLEKKMRRLDLRINRAPIKNTDALRERVTYIFNNLGLTDEESIKMIREEGWDMGPIRYGKIRRELGLFKRSKPGFKPLPQQKKKIAKRREVELESRAGAEA